MKYKMISSHLANVYFNKKHTHQVYANLETLS